MKNLTLMTTCAGLYLILMTGCKSNPIEGKWQYDGGIYNGKSQKASPDYKMQRTYSTNTYEAFLIDGVAEPELYTSGIYEIKGDSIFITSKFSSQPSQTTDITINYKFKVVNKKLTTNGIMPNGMVVEEYWRKVN